MNIKEESTLVDLVGELYKFSNAIEYDNFEFARGWEAGVKTAAQNLSKVLLSLGIKIKSGI